MNPQFLTTMPMITDREAATDVSASVPLAGRLRVERLRAWFGASEVLKGITLSIPDKHVTAIIGPSGCGKSTFVRCLNRMHEVVPETRVEGRVWLGNKDIYSERINPVRLRRHVGMVFQKPNPFPTMSIRENVLAGLRLSRVRAENEDELVQWALEQAALWKEVKDALRKPGTSLSGGQQQRLCIARALALKPQILLMDEPASALDPMATSKIEELIHELRNQYTVVIVTHNMQQAARVSQFTTFLYMGELVEFGGTNAMFTQPKDPRTEDYLTGRFG